MLMETNLYTPSTWNPSPRALWNRCGMYRGGADFPLLLPLQLSTTRIGNDEGKSIARNLKPSFSRAWPVRQTRNRTLFL